MAKFDLKSKYSSAGIENTHLVKIKEEIKEEFIANYEILNLEKEDENVLKSYEKEACNYFQQATKNIYELSRVLYNANKLLARYNVGTFKIWFESIGLKKTFVYDCISRYEVLIAYNEHEENVIDISEDEKEEILSLPIKVINSIKKLDLKKEEIKEVTNSFDYNKTLSEFKEKKKDNIIIEKIVEDLDYIKKELAKVQKKKERISNKIKELELELEELETKEIELEYKLEEVQK